MVHNLPAAEESTSTDFFFFFSIRNSSIYIIFFILVNLRSDAVIQCCIPTSGFAFPGSRGAEEAPTGKPGFGLVPSVSPQLKGLTTEKDHRDSPEPANS